MTEQQKAFCRFVVEGMNQTDAYKAAGYKGNYKSLKDNAARLIANDSVASYIKELRQNAAQETEVTLEWMIKEARELYLLAKSDKAYSAATGALKELGILTGERVEKRDQTNRNVTSLDELDTAEIDRLLARELASREEAAASGERQSSQLH